MNRYSNTFLYDYRSLVSQGFAGFQSVSDAFLGFLFAAEGDKSFALEIENILFADHLWRGQRAACNDVRELATYMCVVLRGVAAAEHHMDSELRAGKKLFAEHFDLRRLRAFLPTSRYRLPPQPEFSRRASSLRSRRRAPSPVARPPPALERT